MNLWNYKLVIFKVRNLLLIWLQIWCHFGFYFMRFTASSIPSNNFTVPTLKNYTTPVNLIQICPYGLHPKHSKLQLNSADIQQDNHEID